MLLLMFEVVVSLKYVGVVGLFYYCIIDVRREVGHFTPFVLIVAWLLKFGTLSVVDSANL